MWADGRPNPFAATRKFLNMLYISWYLHKLVFVSASAVYSAKLRIFFETCAVDNKDNKGRRLELGGLGDFTERIGNVYLMKDNKRPGRRERLAGASGGRV